MRRPVLFVVACLVAGAPLAVAQTPQVQPQPGAPQAAQPPARDKPAVKSGTGVIKGRVVAADTGAAVRRARVTLDSGNPLESRSTTTDLEGRYEFADVAAGSYHLSATKGTFVPSEYGQRRPFDRGKAIDVADGQTTEKVDVTLPRGGIVAGVVLDDVGDPVTGARVTAMRLQFRDGKRGLVSIGRTVETNDIGQYRLYGLPPGSYFVSAVAASANPVLPILNSAGSATTYYPGTLSELEAQRVPVRAGQEKMVPDFTLVPSRLVKVTGTATSSAGTPVQAVMLMNTAQVSSGGGLSGMTTATVRPDGTFRLNNVAPGEYTIMAVALNTGTSEQEITAMPLTVAGEDIADVTLTTAKGFSATGQIIFEQGTPPPGLAPATLMLVGSPASQFTMTGGIARATIHDDWTFEMKGLLGPRLFRFGQGLPTGWMIQSVFHASDDITDKPLDVTDDIDRVVITLTKRPAGVSGTVTDDAGKPVTECSVVIFPEDAALWPPHSARYLRALRPADAGTFEAKALPAGNYLVVAIDTLEAGDENDPDLLEQLRPLATRVAATWGEVKDLRLKLTRFDRK